MSDQRFHAKPGSQFQAAHAFAVLKMRGLDQHNTSN